MKHFKYTFALLLGIFLATASSLLAQNNSKDTNGIAVIEDKRIADLVATYSETQPDGIPGYRVQVFFTAKKAIALAKKTSFSDKFPDTPVKAEAGTPYFKVLAGAFRTKLQAEKLLKLVKEDEEFTGSFIVTSNIPIDEFKVED